ncbi:ComEC/Rec2 family competence protein [Persephonella atlantica]|uniref:ComEC/Rec2 family competence protein n=1 Tax=Persephonella atlantica TaxID=2699429 RepID=A0ABS1GJ74_9AQUI|nr:ComEC/Rec2 family competence protein [Persephonella atlantica]MBK3332984.1 ComEC/Rec2 family competence protein [Persephonella atlantica]
MYGFSIFAFLSLASGIVVSYFGFIYFPVWIAVLSLILSFSLIKTRFFIFAFFISIFFVGISIGKSQRLKDRFYRNSFIGCITTSVPYVSDRFTAFDCYVVQTDKKDLLHKTVKVYLKGENREIFLGSSAYFFGKINISDGQIKAYPYQHFFQINNSSNPFYIVYWLKNRLIENYQKQSYSDETFRLGLALVFGEKGYLGREREEFINAGTSHLLAISGMHVGIILLILLFVFRFSRKVSYYLSLVFLSVYPLFTGLHIPVVRASFLGTLYIISKLKYLKVNPVDLLFFVGFIVLLISPHSLFSVSFQLSFIAVLGILLYSEILVIKHSPVFKYISSSLLMSVIAVLFTTPIILYYFGKFSFTTIIATPVLVLLLFPYLFLSVFNLFTFFSFYPSVYLMEILGKAFISINSFFADFQFVHAGFFPSAVSVAVYLSFLTFIALLKVNSFYKISFSILSLFLFLTVSSSKTDRWEVHVFKGSRYPEFVVVAPHGECFFRGFSRKTKALMDKKRCRKKFLICYYDENRAVSQVRFRKGTLFINGSEHRLENRYYVFYPEPVK